MFNITFSRSDAMAERYGETPEVTRTAQSFVQLTYEALWAGPDGDDVAFFLDGAWQVVDGREDDRSYILIGPYSDIVIYAAT